VRGLESRDAQCLRYLVGGSTATNFRAKTQLRRKEASPKLCMPTAGAANLAQTVKVDFPLFHVRQFGTAIDNPHRTVPPKHTQGAGIPTVHPPDDASLVRPYQFRYRDGFNLIFGQWRELLLNMRLGHRGGIRCRALQLARQQPASSDAGRNTASA